jgi:hypothetical protein
MDDQHNIAVACAFFDMGCQLIEHRELLCYLADWKKAAYILTADSQLRQRSGM